MTGQCAGVFQFESLPRQGWSKDVFSSLCKAFNNAIFNPRMVI